jgi:hypothetical protein
MKSTTKLRIGRSRGLLLKVVVICSYVASDRQHYNRDIFRIMTLLLVIG